MFVSGAQDLQIIRHRHTLLLVGMAQYHFFRTDTDPEYRIGVPLVAGKLNCIYCNVKGYR